MPIVTLVANVCLLWFNGTVHCQELVISNRFFEPQFNQVTCSYLGQHIIDGYIKANPETFKGMTVYSIGKWRCHPGEYSPKVPV